jgi:hypothetical protein
MKAEYGRAVEEFEKAVASSSGLAYAEASLAHACAVSGDTGRALAIYDKLLKKSRASYVPALDLALVSTGLKRYEDAARQLENARRQRCAWLIQANLDPRFRPIEADPGFRALVQFPRRAG